MEQDCGCNTAQSTYYNVSELDMVFIEIREGEEFCHDSILEQSNTHQD